MKLKDITHYRQLTIDKEKLNDFLSRSHTFDGKIHVYEVPLENLQHLAEITYNPNCPDSADFQVRINEIKRERDSFWGDESFPELQKSLQQGELKTPPNEVYELIEKNSTIASNIGIARKRQRLNGDYGDLNIKRYIDGAGDRLFSRRKRISTPAPIINLVCPCNASAWCDIDVYDKFAATTVALTAILEKSGYSVNCYNASSLAISSPRKQKSILSRIFCIKKAGTPINISQIYTFVRPAVSRRLAIMLTHSSLDDMGCYWDDMNSGAGTPTRNNDCLVEIDKVMFPEGTTVSVPLGRIWRDDASIDDVINETLKDLESRGL